MKKETITHKRVIFFGLALSILFTALVMRLLYIQLIMGGHYKQKAHSQGILPIVVKHARGDILDRNGIVLTRGRLKAYLLIFPAYFNDRNSLYDIVGPMTGLGLDELSDSVLGGSPFIKCEILNPDPKIERSIRQGEYPGLMIDYETQRYDDFTLARHLMGYFKKSDNAPQSGIEKEYDAFLRSDDVLTVYAMTDAKRRILSGTVHRNKSKNDEYYDIGLTIDYYVQSALERAMDSHAQKAGGVVVEVETGDILAIASRPNFDQNDIETAKNHKDSLWAVPVKAFSPGSLFKIIVATAGIENGICNGETMHICQGGITINSVRYSCHSERGGLGDISMRQAFAHSCNDAFIGIASRVGGDSIIKMAQKMGLGQPLDIGIHNERGSLPQKVEYAGAGIGNLALGQGKVEVTPIQIAQMMSIIASDGIKKDLSLIREITDQSGYRVENIYEEQTGERLIKSGTARELRAWMGDVTEYGTGIKAYSVKAGGTAGKTGTPQIFGDADAGYYGWFAGFFPTDTPKYAIVILVREESSGGEKAALIFRDTADEITRYTEKLRIP
ncbi:MAG TPA: penicillin-binding protein 2 [Clostridia bacterium]|nr:penicillin-binding protein 2 [Clostridia bacterium]